VSGRGCVESPAGRRWRGEGATETSVVVGVLAFVALVLQTCSLGSLEWYDAYVAAFLENLRGCTTGEWAAVLTNAAPYLGAAIVSTGVAVARGRGAPVADILKVLVQFAVALLLVQGLKVIFGRARPGVPPWIPVGHSFPSGHVANVALAVVTAVSLLRTTGDRGDPVRVTLLAVGLGLTPAVAFTRLFLGRHWLTDVTGSFLLSVGLWGTIFARRTDAPRWIPGSVTLVVLALYVAAASGARIHLPSPATFSKEAGSEAGLRHAALRLDGTAAVWVPGTRKGTAGFLRLRVTDARLRVQVVDHRRPAVLRLVARPLRGLRQVRCRSIELFVDGKSLGAQILRPRERTYAFVLPLLARGSHELRLRTKPPSRRGEPTLALHKLSIDGAAPAVLIEPVSNGQEFVGAGVGLRPDGLRRCPVPASWLGMGGGPGALRRRRGRLCGHPRQA
jgi:membrane-associated phospholipid phosphatase